MRATIQSAPKCPIPLMQVLDGQDCAYGWIFILCSSYVLHCKRHNWLRDTAPFWQCSSITLLRHRSDEALPYFHSPVLSLGINNFLMTLLHYFLGFGLWDKKSASRFAAAMPHGTEFLWFGDICMLVNYYHYIPMRCIKQGLRKVLCYGIFKCQEFQLARM